MTSARKKKQNSKTTEKLLISQNGASVLNGISEITNNQINLHKLNNLLKLFYKLLLYSVVGFFSKLISKIFKF